MIKKINSEQNSIYSRNMDVASRYQNLINFLTDYIYTVKIKIYNSIVVKKYYPEADFRRIIDKLNQIAEVNTDPSIRFKAHLASIYLSFSGIINVEPQHHTFDHEYIFRQITDQLENKLLVSK
jgi:hypothetical protein